MHGTTELHTERIQYFSIGDEEKKTVFVTNQQDWQKKQRL